MGETTTRLSATRSEWSPSLTLSNHVVLSPSCHSVTDLRFPNVIPMWLTVKLLFIFMVTDSYLIGCKLWARCCECIMSVNFRNNLTRGESYQCTHVMGEALGLRGVKSHRLQMAELGFEPRNEWLQNLSPKSLKVKLPPWEDLNEAISWKAVSKFLVKRDVAKTSQIFLEGEGIV